MNNVSVNLKWEEMIMTNDNEKNKGTTRAIKTQYSDEWQNDFDGWDEAYKNWEDTEVSETLN